MHACMHAQWTHAIWMHAKCTHAMQVHACKMVAYSMHACMHACIKEPWVNPDNPTRDKRQQQTTQIHFRDFSSLLYIRMHPESAQCNKLNACIQKVCMQVMHACIQVLHACKMHSNGAYMQNACMHPYIQVVYACTQVVHAYMHSSDACMRAIKHACRYCMQDLHACKWCISSRASGVFFVLLPAAFTQSKFFLLLQLLIISENKDKTL